MDAGDGDVFWAATAPRTDFPALAGDRSVDVAVVGGGIAGLTTALLAKQAGRTVAVLEARRVGRQASGRSTAKVTSQHAMLYVQLVRAHGSDGARAYAEANAAAVGRVCSLVRELQIDCDLQRKPSYVYTASPDRVGDLEEEAETARALGLPAELLRRASLPFPLEAALRFADQAQIHPCKYLAGLARHVDGQGSHVFENTRVLDVDAGSPLRLLSERGAVTARDVVVATHLPIGSNGAFFARAYPQSEPVLAARIEASRLPDGMLISLDDPGLSATAAEGPDGPYLIAAGSAHKPGHTEEGTEAFAALERSVKERFGDAEIRYRWSNHDYTTMDQVPYIGRATAGQEHLLVATGFGAWGLSNGTAAGMILADTLAGRQNSWAGLYDATRKKPLTSAPKFIAENAQVAAHLVGGYLARRPTSADELESGEGGVFKVDGARVAAHRDATGRLHMLSAVCSHMGCVVGWNAADRTWDCPCHGSRFAAGGEVIAGPAVKPLQRR